MHHTFWEGFCISKKVENIGFRTFRIYLTNLWVSSVSSFAQKAVTKKPYKHPILSWISCFQFTLPGTNISPAKWMVGIQSFPFGYQKAYFQVLFAVSFRECHFFLFPPQISKVWPKKLDLFPIQKVWGAKNRDREIFRALKKVSSDSKEEIEKKNRSN